VGNDEEDNGDMLSVVLTDTSTLSGTLTANGEGTFEYDPNGMFDYLADGESADDVFTYMVSDGVLTDTAAVTITVWNTLNPIVDAGPDQLVDEGQLVAFDGSFIDPVPQSHLMAEESYHWDFGDGFTTTGTLTPTHTYMDNDAHMVTLTVTNTLGKTGSDSLLVTMDNVPPQVSDFPDQIGWVGQAVTVTGTITDPGTLDGQTVRIEWGDGSIDTLNLEAVERQFTAAHNYDFTGQYQVEVIVTDKDGDFDVNSFWMDIGYRLLFPLIFYP